MWSTVQKDSTSYQLSFNRLLKKKRKEKQWIETWIYIEWGQLSYGWSNTMSYTVTFWPVISYILCPFHLLYLLQFFCKYLNIHYDEPCFLQLVIVLARQDKQSCQYQYFTNRVYTVCYRELNNKWHSLQRFCFVSPNWTQALTKQ